METVAKSTSKPRLIAMGIRNRCIFCPAGADDVGGSGDKGKVIGVHVGFNPVQNRYQAPKASAFRADALAVMP